MPRLDADAAAVVEGPAWLIPPTWVALTGITLCGVVPIATVAATPSVGARRFDASSGRQLRVLAMILPFYLLILLRGSLLQAMAYLSVLVAAAWFVRERVSSRRSAGASRRSTG